MGSANCCVHDSADLQAKELMTMVQEVPFNKQPTLIFDVGHHTIKYGTNNQLEAFTMPTCVVMGEGGRSLVGETAKKAVRTQNRPATDVFENGMVKDWEALELIYGQCILELMKHVDSRSKFKLLLTVPLGIDKRSVEKISSILFESMDCVSGMYLANTAPLALASEGRENGIVYDIGHGMAQFTPVVN